MGGHTLFFYGTLMAPQILHRVCHGRPDPEPWQKNMLTIRPAILHGYRRHRVRGADYPGIIPGSDDASSSNNSSVLGTVVSGLTDGDIYRLDLFEGDEYVKKPVKVRVLRSASSVRGRKEESTAKKGDEHLRDMLDKAEAELVGEGEEVDATVYVWAAGEGRLESGEWDFESFKRDKMSWWVQADESEW
ncbi:disease resistance protein Aig2, putative [Paecilomyces variotii No. 5]|uniref:Putative gamma-glutamylcyclotransferase n=1 Tax=Byssochlamys spectabilis (strain No. 5 / NBRC 109023) TaxID=1356009 RepID=V5G4C9_BYSSN|nr:disease resistance protein Aig2, putative [Paecilomyces variotii No. 5]